MSHRNRVGALILACFLVMPSVPTALPTYERLHVFQGSPTDGATAFSALIETGDGFLYGTTQRGGAHGQGTVFRMTRSGHVSLLYSFPGGTGGGLPTTSLVLGNDNYLYGTTLFGGTADAGTIFRIAPDGADFQILHHFAGFPNGGLRPYAPLILADDGNFYGVTFAGGRNNRGFAYRVTSAGALTVLDEFSEEGNPFGPLTEASDGHLYGTTRRGAIYRLTKSGTLTVIRRLNPSTEGTTLNGGLVEGSDGDLYGVAREGGLTEGGTLFKVTRTGVLTVLHAFTGGSDGDAPEAGMISAPDGNFYGSTAGRYDTLDRARVFKMTPAGVVTPLHAFAPADSAPHAPLLLASDGHLYGITSGARFLTPTSVAFRLTLGEGDTAAPYGVFDTPTDEATGISGPIAVTGWALDDVEVTTVSVCRDMASGESVGADARCGGLAQIYIGDAGFVEGARPDVAQQFPTAPMANRAGWGYQLLTNFLPGQGNGTFRLHAYAFDSAGRMTNLGFKTIHVANATASLPFGTIDTPGQGHTVSGVVNNFGWVLAKGLARADPPGGGAVTVYIDGVAVGSPGGWTSRPDLVAVFSSSDYSGVTTAAGVFSFDSRMLTNGLHTIAWGVTDSTGRSAGVGSRYFRVFNP